MKKIFLLALFLVLLLSSCTTDNGEFISDDDLEYYGLTELKDLVPSNTFYTNKYFSNIYTYMIIKDNFALVEFNEELFELLKTNDNFSYLGYISDVELLEDGSTLEIYNSNNLKDYYHIEPLDYESKKISFSSCRFFYCLEGSDLLYEILVNSYSLENPINGKSYNMSIFLSIHRNFNLN